MPRTHRTSLKGVPPSRARAGVSVSVRVLPFSIGLCLLLPALALGEDLSQSLSIVAVGDVIPHETVLRSTRTAQGDYDFKPSFRYLEAYSQTADLAICNVETVFTGDGGYSGYPAFDSPDSLLRDLRQMGFDVGITANNHMLDQGQRGFDGTLAALKRNGIAAAGTRSPGAPRYTMVSVRGLNLAIVAYTYAEIGPNGGLEVNQSPVSQALAGRINYFLPRSLDTGIVEIRSTIKNARAAGADVVICFFHWGTEYATSPDANQTAIASQAALAGADLILAAHPHVVQRVEILAPEPGRLVPVFYSLGNILSNQRRDTVDNVLTEDGLVARVVLRVRRGASPSLLSVQAYPTWVYKRPGDSPLFAIIPLNPHMESYPIVAEKSLARECLDSLSRSVRALGSDYFSAESRCFTYYTAPGEGPQ